MVFFRGKNVLGDLSSTFELILNQVSTRLYCTVTDLYQPHVSKCTQLEQWNSSNGKTTPGHHFSPTVIFHRQSFPGDARVAREYEQSAAAGVFGGQEEKFVAGSTCSLRNNQAFGASLCDRCPAHPECRCAALAQTRLYLLMVKSHKTLLKKWNATALMCFVCCCSSSCGVSGLF